MRDRQKPKARTFFLFALVLGVISLSSTFIGCGSSKQAEQDMPPTRYALTGRVVSVDKARQQVEVDAGDIPGFMSAMEMGYSVKDPNLLAPLSPEDQITADVLVKGNDIWLENIVVVKKPDQAKSPASPPPGKQ